MIVHRFRIRLALTLCLAGLWQCDIDPCFADTSEAATSDAQGAVEVTRSVSAEAPGAERVSRYTQALAHVRAGERAVAYQMFSDLWREQPSYDLAMALGQIELGAAEYESAARHFEYAQQHVPPTDALKQGAAIARGYQAATAHVRVVRVQLTPADAELWVEGAKPEGRNGSQITLYLRAGTYRVRVQRPGYVAYEMAYTSSGVDSETLPIVLPRGQSETKRASLSNSETGAGKVPLAAGTQPLAGRSVMLAVGGALALGSGALGVYRASHREAWDADERAAVDGVSGALLLSCVGLSLTTAVTWDVWGALAPHPERGFAEQTWLAGSSEGSVPPAKAVTVLGLQGATLALAGLGVWNAVRAAERDEALRRAAAPGLCTTGADSAGAGCGAWRERHASVARLRDAGAAWIASAGITHLIGLALAEWWPNQVNSSKEMVIE